MEIFPESWDLTTIVAEFGKFRYNKFQMILCYTGDTFQAKVDDLLGDIEGLKIYIEDIMILGKGIFTQHMYQIRVIFDSMSDLGLKLNAPNSSFGLK